MECRRNSLLIVILLFLVSSVLAEEGMDKLYVVGKAKKLNNEFVGDDIRDDNGKVAACFKIITDLSDLSFNSGNGIVKVDNSKPGEYYVFVQPEERILTVHGSGYAPLKVYTYEVGINRLTKGEVWQINISGDKKAPAIPVTILTEPQDAVKIIDGKSLTGKLFQLSEGKHTLKVVKEGYRTYETEIDISTTNALFDDIKLEAVEVVPVFINSTPDKASLFVNGSQKNETPEGLWLFPGEYEIVLKKTGFKDVKKTITVTENGDNRFNFNLGDKHFSLKMNITPSDAKIYINNQEHYGGKNLDLAEGLYKLEVKKNGYHSKSENIKIVKGETLYKNFNLVQMTGNVRFSVVPMSATSVLKRNSIKYNEWTGFKNLKNIPTGSYSITTKAIGYETSYHSFNLMEGETEEISIELNKKKVKKYTPPTKYTSSTNTKTKTTRTRNTYKKKKRSVSSHVYFAYYGDADKLHGLTLGTLKTFGWYITYSLIDNTEFENKTSEDNSALKFQSASFGLNMRLFRGFYLYGGLGYGTITADGEDITDGTEFEFGAITKLGAFHLSLGTKKSDIEDHSFTMLGLGFCF